MPFLEEKSGSRDEARLSNVMLYLANTICEPVLEPPPRAVSSFSSSPLPSTMANDASLPSLSLSDIMHTMSPSPVFRRSPEEPSMIQEREQSPEPLTPE